MTQPKHSDIWVIYPSEDSVGKAWVAHSLTTDQIGMGDCVVEALVELKASIRCLLEEAAKDSRVQVISLAPLEFWKKTEGAKKLDPMFVRDAEKLLQRKKGPPPMPKGSSFETVQELESVNA
ncbi:MAG: hypothetical protein HZA50_11840 [Planctomycetes bacterium]|nr:hypothetical protein [Planctomycetota bacterium]